MGFRYFATEAMKKLLFFILFSLGASPLLLAQGEIDEQTHLLFNDESTFGIFMNSNGFGANYRHGFYRNARNQFILDVGMSYVKHPKEAKTQVAYTYSTRRYVFGKAYLFWELRGTVGWQKEIYRKYDKGGISVRWYNAGGVALGFLKPIYYEVYTFSAIGEATSRDYMKFDAAIHQTQIGGRGPFFKGFSELGLVPGITAKTGLSFEYSQKDAIVHALEAGISLTLYPKRIPIMATELNNYLFFNLNVGYRFGRIVDISEAAGAKSRKQRKAERKAQGSVLSMPGF